MKRLILFCLTPATFLKANVDPLQPTNSSETPNQSALPFDVSGAIPEKQSDEPVFLLSVIDLREHCVFAELPPTEPERCFGYLN